MSTYFPYLRGKQNELLALREVAARIAANGAVCPIIEVVKFNSTTRISMDHFVENGMPFVLITNPEHGEFKGNEQKLWAEISDSPLSEYDNYIPALRVTRDTHIREVRRFCDIYGDLPLKAAIYQGEPASQEVLNWLAEDKGIYHHIIVDGHVAKSFVNAIPKARRVMINDNFRRQTRNADYPESEHFTDMNTDEGNPDGLNWGDYSIQGDNYSESGGPAYAVAIHHLYFDETTGAIRVGHYLSDRQETIEDTPGKIIEAVKKLVVDLARLPPETAACGEYREMAESENSRGLGYLKRLAILHHLQLILGNE